MKFSIEKNTLLTQLQILSKAIPTRSTLPIISCALFTTKENRLKIRTTDLEISISLNCSVENGTDGSVAIPMQKLMEITHAMPESMIRFTVSDIGKVNIDCETGHYTIMGQPADEFPAEQLIENGQSFTVSTDELRDIIRSTSYAASKDDMKPVLQGVLFQVGKDGFVSVATDGHRLVKLEKKEMHSLDYTGAVVVPIKFLTLLLAQLEEKDETTMLIGDNHIQINMDKIMVTSRIIKDPYPDYEGVIPKDNNKTLVVNRDHFFEAIKRVSIFSNKSSKQIALELTENSVTITTEDPENITTGKETLDCNYDGDPMTIGYNASYLREVLQHQQTDEIKIMLKSPLNAGLFVPLEQNDNDNKTTLLMPIRLKD
ncbi:MAG: DNA polymerase III subunit beta [Candidatus Marinimicrobia bacterium]|jgi:DNA polymerase-3 subunit beta|nr:DNA polymerase III subunit beta [Candidatus Neomarinimicrobiota bacterium]MDP6936369.1 DNA polymerase III subunit beta [Candidatus Neomarinimicrobiota bacterium]